MKFLNKIREYAALLTDIQFRLDQMQRAIGRVENRQISLLQEGHLHQNEFQVFSQWGEDGIIQFLLRYVLIERRVFVEFGVQDYRESNTRFLLQNDNWSGLVIDGGIANVEAIRRDPMYWRYNLKAECAFITRENINDLLVSHGIGGDIGLLSIDIDGNDYWVWEAIDCIQPRIVVVEYNSLFGPRAKITIPYDPRFFRTQAHYSNLYWGASIAALSNLAERKGYALVGSNSAGNNVFFVRRDLMTGLTAMLCENAWVCSQFRESRDPAGELTFLDTVRARALIGELPVYDIEKGITSPLHEAISV